MIAPRGWTVHQADHEGVVFRGPDGSWYPAVCNYGNFAHECEEAFDRVRTMPLRAGLVRERMRLATREWPNGEVSTFQIEYPERLFRGGPSTVGAELQGFRILTPERHRVELFFERRRPPVELAELITALFGEPNAQQEEKDDGQGQLRQVAVPDASPGGQEPGDGRAGEGLEEHLGLGQAGGQRDVQRRDARQEVVPAAGKPTKQELLAKFLSVRTKTPDSSAREPHTAAPTNTAAGRLAP